MFRKILALCLTCLLVMGLLAPATSFVQAQGNGDYDMTAKVPGGVLYFDSRNNRVVGGDLEGDVVIPSEIRGVPVLSIGEKAFYYRPGITSLVLPEGLITIEDNAFGDCENLESATFPSTLVRVESGAFWGTGLKKIELPDSIRYIGQSGFASTSPEELILPEVPLYLGNNAFSNCDTIEELVIPDSLELGNHVFSRCSGLKKVTLPETMTELPDGIFWECEALNSIEFPPTLEILGDSCFWNCWRLADVTFPDALRSIGDKCFYGCSALETVVFPDGVTSIGSNAFSKCSLKEVVLPKSLERMGNNPFYGSNTLFENRQYGLYMGDWLIHGSSGDFPRSADVIVEEGVVGIAEGALYSSLLDSYDKEIEVTLPSTVKYLSAECFLDSRNWNHVSSLKIHPDNPYFCVKDNILYTKDLSTVIFCGDYCYKPSTVLPNELRRIGDKAFVGCETLTSIVLPSGVEEIGAYGLSAPNLKSVTLSKSLRTIGDHAFYDCFDLKTLVIPGRVETIGDYAFTNAGLYAVNFGKNIRTIGDYAFAHNALQHVALGDKVEYIGKGAFQNAGVRYVNLGPVLQIVGAEAFAENTQLREVVFPGTLEELGDRAFYQCEGLERAIFHCPPTVLGGRVFYYDHRYEGENGSASTVQVEVLPKLTVYYSLAGQWDTVRDPAGIYWQYAPKQVYLDVARESWYADAVDYASGHELMNGVGSGRFSPDGTMTRAMVVTVLWRLQGSPAAERTHGFTDVKETDWYAQAVNWAFARGIANGVNDSRFHPDGSITREQLATFLYRYASYCDPDLADHGALPDFPDKGTVSSYAEEALVWACGEGLINGVKDGSTTYLRPKASATRAQVAAILMRYMEK